MAGARPEHGIVQRIEGVVRRDGRRELSRIEPRGSRRKVEAPCHLTLRRSSAGGGSGGQKRQKQGGYKEVSNVAHERPPWRSRPCRDRQDIPSRCACLATSSGV